MPHSDDAVPSPHTLDPNQTGLAPPVSGPSRRLTRDDVLRLAQSGKAWEFVPLALQVLRSHPDDQQMRCVLATVYTRLQLRTPALEQLASLTEQTRAMPAITSLTAQVSRLADSRIDPARLISQCKQNVDALATRGIDLTPHIEPWNASLDHAEFHSTLGGNVARRESPGIVDRAWTRLRDDTGEAHVFPLPHLADTKEKGISIKPYTLEGIDPPWMFLRIFDSTPAQKDGYHVRIRVVQASVMELLDGFALTDLRKQIADPCVQWFVGPDASGALAEDLRQRLGTQVLGPVIALSSVRTPATPRVEDVLKDAVKEQATLHVTLEARVRAVYKDRTPGYWAGRFKDALGLAEWTGRPARTSTLPIRPGGTPGPLVNSVLVPNDEHTHSAPPRPLRVLIPTCRYSTFIQHSSADLAEAFRHAGHEARIVIEPDQHSHLSPIAYLRAMDEFEPDVVVLINYTRQRLETAVPPGIPFVTWLQDSMPHQFNTKIGAALGPLDFIVGHLHPELFTQFGYPDERNLSFPVVVSLRKFHSRTPETALLKKHECELAYVSHHSETPETMHTRLVMEVGRATPAARVLDGLWSAVFDIASDPLKHSAHHELREAARRQARHVLNADPDEQAVTQLVRQYCLPIADRIVRHQTLNWAADIADQRGWRFHLYGRGWEQHPRFAQYARGELGHGEELRAVYFAAKVHLQATINTPVHQRIMECAMSGGLPLCRLHSGVVQQLLGRMYGSLACEAMPDVCLLDDQIIGYRVADSSIAMSCLAQLQQLGIPIPSVESGWMLIRKEWIDYYTSRESTRNREVMGLEELLGDLSLFMFSDPASLEAMASRAVEDDGWRRTGSELIAARARAGLTHDVFANKVLELIAGKRAG